jgi:hypothetical protein
MEEDGVAETATGPTADAIWASLEAILAWSDLRLSERNRRFLAFVVSETVAGHAERIKAYTIGVDVFGRDESFDPATDPIVRIEATRIRSALSAYYDGPGMEEPVQISIPPGSYVPAFAWPSKSCPTEVPSSPSSAAVSYQAAVFVIHDHSPQSDVQAALRGELFSEAIIRCLARAGVKVHLVPPSDRSAALDAIRRIYARPERAYSLDIAVRPLTDQRRYSWRLSDLSTGEVLAVDFSDHNTAARPCLELIDGLAEHIAETAAVIHAEIDRQERSGP